MRKRISKSKLLSILKSDPDKTIRIYSAMSKTAYAQLTKNKILSPGDTLEYLYEEYKDDPGYADYMSRSYNIMRDLMKNNIQDFSGDYPLWGWLSKPNLRKYHSSYKYDTVVVYATVPRKRLFITHIDKWEEILNLCPLEDDEHKWEILNELYEKTNDVKYLQLENLSNFDINSKINIFPQVCIDKLYLHEVYKVKHFSKACK